MAKFLLLLLLFLLRSNYALAQACYCTTTWHYNSTFGQSCTANADCWACQQGAYNLSWQQAFCPSYQVPTCQTEVQTQIQSCPINQTGVITQTKTKTCTTSGQGIWGEWVTTSNTCIQNPPTCQTSTQTQTLSCQTGYTGSITQTRFSTCPNPYGTPIWQAWTTTQNTCVKSVTNPTNPTSPVSPISPTAPTTPTSNTSVQTTPSAPVTVEALVPTTTTETSSAPSTSNQTSSVGSSAPNQASSVPSTPAQADAKGTTQSTPKGKTQTVVGLVLSLETISKPAIKQPNVFVEQQIVQGLPNDILFNNQLFLDLYGVTIGDQSSKLKKMADDAVEIEQ